MSRTSIEKSVNHILGGLLNPSRVIAPARSARSLTESAGAYTSAQSDPVGFSDYLNRSHSYDGFDLSSFAGDDAALGASAAFSPWAAVIGAVLGIGRDLLGYAHADKAAQVAFDRQNDFYINHMSMSAKVAEFQEAGLNPMALGSSGPGATSAPSVQAGQTPSGESAFFGLLNTLLDYKLKNRELDIADRRVDVDSRRVDLEEERLPSLIDSAFARAENSRAQVDWYNANIAKMSKEVELMDAHIGRVFAETDKLGFESYLLSIEGKFRGSELSLKVQNLAKDLGVKDSTISLNDAQSAMSYAKAHLDDITSTYQGALMQSQTSENNANAQYKSVETIVEQFKHDYRAMHGGAEPPSGILGALIGISSDIAIQLTGGVVNPNYVPNRMTFEPGFRW